MRGPCSPRSFWPAPHRLDPPAERLDCGAARPRRPRRHARLGERRGRHGAPHARRRASGRRSTIPGGEALDFRDVEALSGDVLVLMAAGPGDASRIYRSTDAGTTWTLVHTNPDKAGFYDAIAFWDAKNGLVLGDPVERQVSRPRHDRRRPHLGTPPKGAVMPPALAGEGAFAASGTCLFASEGRQRRLVRHRRREGLARVPHGRPRKDLDRRGSPVPAGNASSGLFSIAFLDAQARLRDRRRLQAARLRRA